MADKYVSKVYLIAESCAKRLDLAIEKVEWVLEDGINVLRIIAQSKEGLDIEEASALNEAIGDELDKYDFIDEEYTLEVSSPGLEESLETDDDIKGAIGEYVHIDFENEYFISKANVVKEIEGTLLDYQDGEFTVKLNIKGRIKNIKFKKDEIILIRKAIMF